ncbi:MAG: phosphatase PAP2 family protein [Bacteroidota bacterium]|nr:phosphatase PAP2 family protein [Bacteroidota bacterium]
MKILEKNISNTQVIENFAKVNAKLLVFPLLLLGMIILFLYSQGALSAQMYAEFQKECFLSINKTLSQYPVFHENITQMGDALVMLSLLSVFFLYAPKMWEALITSSLLSLIFSAVLKNLLDVPRPATIFDSQEFTIIGKMAVGYSSCPSGHSITIFTSLTVLMLAFLPSKWLNQIVWCFAIVALGLFMAFSRVTVGAHLPLDVVIGSAIGFICGVLGIIISQKYKIFGWISNYKFQLFFIVLFATCCALLVYDLTKHGLVVVYGALLSLIVSLFLITKEYVKKNKR